MLKKVTVLVVTCFIGLGFSSQKALAQEGGEEREEEVIINTDSSNIDVQPEETMGLPSSESIRIPANEIPSVKPLLIDRQNNKPILLPTEGEKPKVKETKSDVSFNLLYYLFYKFKHVDVD